MHLHEASARVGGLLGSTFVPGRGLVEQAANGVLASKKFIELCQEINCPLLSAQAINKKRYIFRLGSARRWPLGIFESLRFICGFLTLSFRRPENLETLHTWASRVFGRGAASFLIEPALQGIYGSSTHNLSAALIWNSMNTRPTKHSELKGLVSPPQGMEQFCKSLEQTLRKQGVQFHMESSVDSAQVLALSRNHQVVLATSLKNASALLGALEIPP